MRKTYRLILALMLCAVGAMNVNAEEISLKDVPFCSWNGWTLDAQSTGTLPLWEEEEDPTEGVYCLYRIGIGSTNVYGDTQVINFADLTNYSKLVVTATDGTPRFLFNRDVDEGQWNADESQSHLIDNTQGGWSGKYFSSETTDEGTVYTVDLKQMVKDKGYAHLHAIKGASWQNVTITDMVVVSQGKNQQVGWINLINNSDMEGDDVSSFFTKVAKGDPAPSEITDGVGVNGSRGIVVEATAKESDAWDNQFWFRFNEPLNADAKYRVSFDYRADAEATVSTQAHAEPSDYIWYEMFGNLNFTTEWQNFSLEGTVTASQSTDEKKFLSVAFNLNELADANNYYFDNIRFEIYKAGTSAEFSDDVVLIDFGFETNLPELVAASGSRRIFFPNDCVTVKAEGKDQSIFSVEGLEDGRFYIFLDDGLSDDDEVEVTFTNPAGDYHLTYTSGPNAGADVPNFSGFATNNWKIQEDEGYPYVYVTPTVMSADPEDGSFSLPNNISEFKLKFDKKVDCAALQATINGNKLAVNPSSGFADEVTLIHTGTFANGEYVIKVTKIYPEERLDDSIYGEYTYTVNIGEIVIDPNDQPYELIPAEYFENAAAGGIPEGYYVLFGEEERTSDAGTFGSGSRIFDFGAGGDFVKGLYFREGYVEYGSTNGYELPMEANKTYKIRFNTAMWKDNGTRTRFEIFDESGEAVLTQMISNAPNVNGSTGAVTGSTVTELKFSPEASGNYILRWTSALDETGNPGFIEIILANVACTYMPNTLGVEEMLMLTNALENAKNTLAENDEERYHGAAFDALKAAIEEYDGKSWSSPSKYKEAAEALNAAAQALKDHRQNCDDYDTQIKKAIDVIRQNRENKFAKTDLYAELTVVVNKYHGTSEWVNVSGDEENPEWELNYSFDVLTDDSQLESAIAELKDLANTTSLLFTEGVSATGDSGVKVLVDRLRRGAETLKALGVPEDDYLIVAANKAFTDDDDLAEEMKGRIAIELYGQLKEANNTLFEEIVNEETLETEAPVYDMSVFFKNPNIYALQVKDGVTEENVPGWEVPEGNGEISTMWVGGTPRNVPGIAEDVVFTKYHAVVRYEQTITDLPAGVYTVVLDAVSWADDDTTDGYVYVKTTESGDDFAAAVDLAYYGQYVGHHDNEMEGIVVTDGVLTVGANFGPNSQWMFDQIKAVNLTAPAAGFDYAKAYTNGIETLGNETAKVRSIELYDLNGRRISQARQGIVLVKKQMSDGTVRTEKVIRK